MKFFTDFIHVANMMKLKYEYYRFTIRNHKIYKDTCQCDLDDFSRFRMIIKISNEKI